MVALKISRKKLVGTEYNEYRPQNGVVEFTPAQ
jgi:hypothetical protein